MTVEPIHPTARLLRLQHDAVSAVVDPGHGGVLKAFSWRGRHIFRPAAAGGGDDPLEQSCFPMVPFCNRVAFGRFTFAGREIHLPRNWEGDAHTIHGEGWRAPWSVVDSSDRHVHMALAAGGGAWPWHYRAEQRIDLEPDGLSIELSAVNTGHESMPLMLGLHPYFATDPRTHLQARLPRYWVAGDTNLPGVEADTPPQWGLGSPAAGKLPTVDNCFSGWDGAATLFRSDCTIGIRASGCRWLHLYRPAQQEYLCIEPQSAPTGALNRDGASLQVLQPGERAAISLRVSVEAC
ncbi:MAG TPA: aldose 1-epimerase [Burkholderiaceae bacterium]|nr:aldose 1-epimerase [Burkholderiaceae bacterium]